MSIGSNTGVVQCLKQTKLIERLELKTEEKIYWLVL